MINEDNKPMFCAIDVAKILGYSNQSDAILRHCKGVVKRDTLTDGGIQKASYIPESDVYRLVMRSKLPEAEGFQDWVCEDILPSIRKTGGHIYSTETDTPETILDKYKSKKKLLDLKDFVSFKQFNNILNKHLKNISPGLFFYMARHTWASFARNKCDISKDDVAMSLNHIDQVLKTTDTYIDPDWSIIDRANRKVLDYVASIE